MSFAICSRSMDPVHLTNERRGVLLFLGRNEHVSRVVRRFVNYYDVWWSAIYNLSEPPHKVYNDYL